LAGTIYGPHPTSSDSLFDLAAADFGTQQWIVICEECEPCDAHFDVVIVTQGSGLGDLLAIDQHSVGTLQITDETDVIPALDLAVSPTDLLVSQ
jgi:hypothetical protein